MPTSVLHRFRIVPLALLLACGPREDGEFESCTMVEVPGIRVTASDARTGARVDSLSGYVRDGAWVDSLREMWSAPAEAAAERPGTYEVHVRAPGYAPWDTAGVVVHAGSCHVGTQELYPRLTPLGARGR